MHLSVAFSLLAATACLAAPATKRNNYVLHEKRHAEPVDWAKRSRAHPDEVLPVKIGLTQRNLHRIEEFVLSVSDPTSPNYGKHWSAEKVANVFAPAKHTADNVESWLIESGIAADRLRFSSGRNWIHFDAPISEIEGLFNTEYYTYEHQDGGFRHACEEYHLPEHIKDHIDFAMPTIQLEGMVPQPRILLEVGEVSTQTGLTGLSNCSNLITIECMRALYQFGPSNATNSSNVTIGIGEWADFLYMPDLDIFFENFTSPQIPAGTRPEFISIDGGQHANFTYNNETQSGIESALDFDTMYSIVYPQEIRLYQVCDGVNCDSVGTFDILLDALDESFCTYLGGDWPYIDPAYPDPNEGGYTGPLQCGGAPNSTVMSFSYGQIEASLPIPYQTRQCTEWSKLALQGVSVLFASGDSGVANRYNAGYNNSCLLEDGPYVDQFGPRFSPSFPITCPWLTSVGATFILPNTTVSSTEYTGEQAVEYPDASNPYLDFYSGGGFSNTFEMPSYQSDAVTTYLTNYTPPYNSTNYNNTGKARGFPDVSALGNNLATVWLGQVLPIGGTSASTPLFAGLVALLNSERANVGKSPVGFLNPVLYAHPEMFHDVTIGANPGCGTGGFNATPGWDPVTGLGTPNYPKMREVFLSLP